jgi:anaerobic magnesium-protoporphyrin IX monomethyl ester cyclase
LNVALITPTPPNIDAFGVRTVSSVLKREGFPSRIIFLPGGIEHLRFDSSYVYRYEEKTLARIADLCRDVDLIGISFMSLYFDRAAQVTAYLRQELHGKPIIWGGTHPTYRPEQCLKHCDAVCIGEGEYAIVDIARKMASGVDYTDVQSCWFRSDLGIRRNEAGPIVENLDELPFVDYDFSDHYVFEWRTGEVRQMTAGIMQEQFLKLPYFGDQHRFAYRTMTSRGCPHKCSYCASSAMMRLRRRSVDNVIRELKEVLQRFNYIEIISFFDDTFFASPVEYFEEFRDRYKSEIGLPFHAQCSPTTLSKRKLDLLVDAGLYFTEMGIQTGSERIKRMYRRVIPDEKVLSAAALLNRYTSRMLVPDYHIILDNPWETVEDVRDTLRLLLSLPGKFRLELSSLIFFPGTELNDRAREEGIIRDEVAEVCRKPFTFPKGTYLNYLIYLSGYSLVPRGLLRILSSDPMVRFFHRQQPSRFYVVLFILTNKIRLACKGAKALLTGDFKRIINYFRLVK